MYMLPPIPLAVQRAFTVVYIVKDCLCMTGIPCIRKLSSRILLGIGRDFPKFHCSLQKQGNIF